MKVEFSHFAALAVSSKIKQETSN